VKRPKHKTRKLMRRKHAKRRVCAMFLIGFMILSLVETACAATAWDKLKRGVINSSLCFLEVPKQISQESKDHDKFTGFVYGTISGTGYAAARATTGIIDTGTFLIPEYDKPIMDPEYVYE